VLAEELQTAFAITVVGVMVGLIAFTVALIRERFYTKDLADLEFLREVRGDAAVLVPASAPQPSAAAPGHLTSTDQPTAPGIAGDVTSEPLPGVAAPVSAAQTGDQPTAVSHAVAPVPTPSPTPAATPPPVAPAPSPVPGVIPPAFPPAPDEPKKKKFGIKKKSAPPTVPNAPAFPPPPPPVNPHVGEEDKKDA
jgi:hypothetical protein